MMKPEVIKSGDRVRVLYPAYAAGETGIVLQPEVLQDGSKTGHWLVQLEGKDIILALLPQEMTVIART